MAQTKVQLIESGAVGTADIADDSITADKLADTTVTAASYTTADITVDAQGRITAASSLTGQLSNRNLIINGDMRIDQRNGGSAITLNSPTQLFPVDRFWGYGAPSAGVYTLEQVEDAPAGFRHSVKGEVTTADASIASNFIYVLEYRVEGYDTQHLEWGTANAKTVTLSFWVKVSQAGTYTGAVHNNSQNRSYGFTWTASGTDWEHKTITIPGDTTGTWTTNNFTGMSIVLFALGVGSTYESANSNQWEARSTFAVSGNTYLIGTLNSTFNITGVQLEVGDKATPFEHRSYGDELARCQRYFAKLPFENNYYLPQTTNGYTRLSTAYPTVMRAIPTATSLTSGWNLSPTTHLVTGYYTTIGNATTPAITLNAEL